MLNAISTLLRRTVLIACGLGAAIGISVILALFGIFFLTPLILMYLAGQRIHAWLFNLPYKFTEDTKAGSERIAKSIVAMKAEREAIIKAFDAAA